MDRHDAGVRSMDSRWSRIAARGARTLAWSVIAWLALTVLGLPVGALTGDWTLRTSPMWAQLLATEPGLVGYLATQVGWWWLCAPGGAGVNDAYRRVARWSALLVSVKIIVVALMTPLSAVAGDMGERGLWLLTVFMLASVVVVGIGMLAQAAQLVCGLSYIGDLARSMGDAALAQRARRTLWGTVTLFGIVIVGLVVGAGLSVVRLELGAAVGGGAFVVATAIWVWMFARLLFDLAARVDGGAGDAG